jgi:hypothetical protein
VYNFPGVCGGVDLDRYVCFCFSCAREGFLLLVDQVVVLGSVWWRQDGTGDER